MDDDTAREIAEASDGWTGWPEHMDDYDSSFPLDVVPRFVRRVPHMLAIGMMKVKAAMAEDPYNANLGARWEHLLSAFQKYPMIDTKED